MVVLGRLGFGFFLFMLLWRNHLLTIFSPPRRLVLIVSIIYFYFQLFFVSFVLSWSCCVSFSMFYSSILVLKQISVKDSLFHFPFLIITKHLLSLI